ncbi:MAG TPA: alpha-ribazole phosphatase family protein [Chthoniobacterales bacterium]
MRLIFMRHPAVEFATLRCFGQTDVDLSFAGNSSLKPLAEEASGLLPEQVLSSDLKRCRLLAEQIADRLRITPVFDPIWREIDFGFWENRTWAAIQREEPEAFAEWVADFVATPAPGGESFLQLQKRALTAISKINPISSNVLVVTHAGVIRAAYSAFANLPLSRAFDYNIPYGGMLHCGDGVMSQFSTFPNLPKRKIRPAVNKAQQMLKIET